ncbi:MAG: hypothetical protein HYT72_00200 [Candidatus Aenigmarchaeota archaeon]|nr:hypothetical protein [Candidatus Aenigmarchaeota archaeon]
MAPGYNGNGRPKVEVYGGVHSTFTLHTPDGIHRNLGREDAAAVLTSYPIKPVIEFPEGGDISGGAKTFFRRAIENMPLQV